MKYQITRKTFRDTDAYCLTDEHGQEIPYQQECVLRSSPDELPTFTVTFTTGEKGLRIIDEDSE